MAHIRTDKAKRRTYMRDQLDLCLIAKWWLRWSSERCQIALCEVYNSRQVLSSEMMCFYSVVLLRFGIAINHCLQSTAKRHLLLSASLVVGQDYSQNKVWTGWLIEGSAEVHAAVYFHTSEHLFISFSWTFMGWSCLCVSLSLHKIAEFLSVKTYQCCYRRVVLM